NAPSEVGAEVWEFRAAIVRAGLATPSAALGTAAVGLSLEPLHGLQRRRLTMATVFAALSALIGALGAGLLARATTRPLRALVDAADRISRGDFAARVAEWNRDEVGRLAGSFNAMAESLARSRDALDEKVRELERANHLKSEFLATVSHELRTPLNVILGYTEMLAEGAGGTVTPAQAEMIATIDRYSRNQLELITSVLDFTRLSSGKVSLNLERFALAPLLAEALGGSVSATSRLGEASLFRVLIPCVAGPEAADPGSSATSALDAAARNATASRRRARSMRAVRGSPAVRAPKP